MSCRKRERHGNWHRIFKAEFIVSCIGDFAEDGTSLRFEETAHKHYLASGMSSYAPTSLSEQSSLVAGDGGNEGMDDAITEDKDWDFEGSLIAEESVIEGECEKQHCRQNTLRAQ